MREGAGVFASVPPSLSLPPLLGIYPRPPPPHTHPYLQRVGGCALPHRYLLLGRWRRPPPPPASADVRSET